MLFSYFMNNLLLLQSKTRIFHIYGKPIPFEEFYVIVITFLSQLVLNEDGYPCIISNKFFMSSAKSPEDFSILGSLVTESKSIYELASLMP